MAPFHQGVQKLADTPAAVAALREVLSDMSAEQAEVETAHAIAYAAANHTAWFCWSGV